MLNGGIEGVLIHPQLDGVDASIVEEGGALVKSGELGKNS